MGMAGFTLAHQVEELRSGTSSGQIYLILLEILQALKCSKTCFRQPGQLAEQFLVYVCEVEASLALHALLERWRHIIEHLRTSVNRHQVVAHVVFARADPGKIHRPVLIGGVRLSR